MGAEITCIRKPGNRPFHGQAATARKCVSLNMKTAKGRDRLKLLINEADIVIENFAPGYLDSLGLSYSELSRINPRLITVSITPYGQTGPRRNDRSAEMVASAMGGQACVCGQPEKPPLKPFGPQAYSTACLFAANGILLALWQRNTTQRGQHIDISIHECAAATLDHVLVHYFYEGVIAGRQGDLYGNKAFRIFPCRDGYILLSVFMHWQTLVEWLESEGLAEDLGDPKWLDADERPKNSDHIIQVLEKWTRRHTMRELVEKGQLMHFPWAGIASVKEVVDNPQLNERGFIKQISP
jgi:CoA:oxalate CoA-transferase